MRTLKTAVMILGLLLAGSAISSTMQPNQHSATVGRASLGSPIPQCPYRVCPPPTQPGR